MNRLTLLIYILLLNISYAQTPIDASTLSNSFTDLLINGETDKAVEVSMNLFSISPSSFIKNIHIEVAQQIQNDSKKYGEKYLEKLLLQKNEKINSIIFPIHLWSKSITSSEKNELKKIVEELNLLVNKNSTYDSESARYCLLILQEFDKKKAIDDENKEKILKKNIENLEQYPFINKITFEKLEGIKRAWHRYLLAYSYNYLFILKPDVEGYLKKASEFSPDTNDQKHKVAYFYDAALLTGNIDEFGFQYKYLKYLIDNNRTIEAFNLISEITFSNPTDENLKYIKNFYQQLKKTESFDEYWKDYFNKKGRNIPKIKIEFKKESLDLSNKINHWVLIDIWGTWCSPCLKELPKVQSFFDKNNGNKKIKIYTLSFESNNLIEFLNKNKYTFPVSEIDKTTNDLFNITSYPTKILISPEGNYVIIPNDVDWEIFIKNYTLM